MMAQWLALLPHSEKVPGSIPRLVVGPFCVEVLSSMSAWVSAGCLGFLPGWCVTEMCFCECVCQVVCWSLPCAQSPSIALVPASTFLNIKEWMNPYLRHTTHHITTYTFIMLSLKVGGNPKFLLDCCSKRGVYSIVAIKVSVHVKISISSGLPGFQLNRRIMKWSFYPPIINKWNILSETVKMAVGLLLAWAVFATTAHDDHKQICTQVSNPSKLQ